MKLTAKAGLSVVLFTIASLIGLQSPAGAFSSAPGAITNCAASWSSLGLVAPTIASMTINGETVTSPLSPANGQIGVYICPGQAGARASISLYQESGGSGYVDLTGAHSPLGSLITASTPITLTINNFGSSASTFRYGTVFGSVNSWTTNNLGTPSASLVVSFDASPYPYIDSVANPGQCAPAPLTCNISHSSADILNASMDINMVPGDGGAAFSGAYFSIQGASGGAINPLNEGTGNHGFTAAIAGPHFKQDGTSLASGSFVGFLSDSSIGLLFGLQDPSDFDPASIDVTRIESGTETTPPFTVSRVTGGYRVAIPTIGFSSPAYEISGPTAGGGRSSGDQGGGYRMFTNDGGVFNYGGYSYYGSANTIKTLGTSIVTGVNTPDGAGYWEVGANGAIYAYGDAKYYGGANTLNLKGKIVGAATTPDGRGYWEFAADGGVFSYGDAKFFGSAGALKLNKPIVGGASSPSGNGYWLFASDGGVFAYGDAKFYGSTANVKLVKPIIGGAADPQGTGYTLFASDGGVFAYGTATFFGSPSNLKLNAPIIAGGVTPDADGYVLFGSDGGVYNYGNAPFLGSLGGTKLTKPVVAGA